MAILKHGGAVNIVRLNIPLSEFPTLLKEHLKSDVSTPAIEKIARKLVKDDFPEHGVVDFVKRVCIWGNYAGVYGKVLKHNTIRKIKTQLIEAHAALRADDPKTAIEAVTLIKGLAVSFGSKHLKFLNPDKAGVLDSIISERLGYKRTADGYVEFLSDCNAIRDILNQAGISASATRQQWRVSDVEMAIFKKVR